MHIAWAQAELGRRIVTVAVMPGATSSDLYQLTDELDERWVLRLFTKAEWLREEPDLAAHEAAALQIATAYRLATPRLVAFDESGATAGAPAVLMSHLAGSVELRPADMDRWNDSLVAAAVALDELSTDGVWWRYRSWHDPRTSIPAWSDRRELWDAAWGGIETQPVEPEVVLHRDLHPCNMLWIDDRISGVVDWVNLCVGPRGVDVAHCAINLAAMYGTATAERFVRRWEQETSRTHHPYWDLITAIDWVGMDEVYPPWVTFGLTDLTIDVVRGRIETWVGLALVRLG